MGRLHKQIDVGVILADPSVSYWLKAAIKSSLQRDPVDALGDAETLCEVLRQKLASMLDERQNLSCGAGD